MEVCRNTAERNHRFLEEALELVQSLGCTAAEARMLVDYTFGRPTGEPRQEVGGVMVTLAALCTAADLSMRGCGEDELERCWKNIARIRAKQATKPPSSPLPGHACTDAELKVLEPLYDQAVDFAKSETTMSVSKMQRKFMIGYNRAARLCERLADEGILIYEKSAYHWRGSASNGGVES